MSKKVKWTPPQSIEFVKSSTVSGPMVDQTKKYRRGEKEKNMEKAKRERQREREKQFLFFF